MSQERVSKSRKLEERREAENIPMLGASANGNTRFSTIPIGLCLTFNSLITVMKYAKKNDSKDPL